MGAATLDDALVRARGAPSDAAAVRRDPAMHPAELLGSAAMRRVLDTLRTRFDRILIDMPPVAPLADVHDARADGGRPADDRPRRRHAEAGDRARARRASITPKVLGLVLNEAGDDGAADYGYGSYGVRRRITTRGSAAMQLFNRYVSTRQPHGLRRRAAADLRIGRARRGVQDTPDLAANLWKIGARHAGLPAVPLLQRLLRPDARPLEPRADRAAAAGGRRRLDRARGALLRAAAR